MKALGMIELFGYVPAVEALDAALKAADVSLHSLQKAGGGLVSIMVHGDVAAVKAAIDAAQAAAERVGTVIAVHVIPRPDGGVDLLLDPEPEDPKDQAPEQEPVREETEKAPTVAEAETMLVVDVQPEEVAFPAEPSETEADVTADRQTLLETLTFEQLDAMTVKELRVIARTLEIDNMTKKEIRFGKKEELVSSICEYLEKGN